MPDLAGFPSAEPRGATEESEAVEATTAEPVLQNSAESEPEMPQASPMPTAEERTPVAEPQVTAASPKPEPRRAEIPKPHLTPLQRLSPQRTTVRWPRFRSTSEPVPRRAPESETQTQSPTQSPQAEPRIEPRPALSPTRAAAPAKKRPASSSQGSAQSPQSVRVDSPSRIAEPKIAPAEPPPAHTAGLQPAPRGDSPVTASAPAPRRESRIRIGRIDVRLNNRPALPARAPTAAAPPQGASNWLEARYLSRFALRP